MCVLGIIHCCANSRGKKSMNSNANPPSEKMSYVRAQFEIHKTNMLNSNSFLKK